MTHPRQAPELRFRFDVEMMLFFNVKEVCGKRVTTAFVRQGHYAHDEKAIADYRPADYTIERITDLVKLDFGALTGVFS